MEPRDVLRKAANACYVAKKVYAAAASISTAVAVMGVTATGAGSVELTLPAGTDTTPPGWMDVNSTDAGSFKCTPVTGAQPSAADASDAGTVKTAVADQVRAVIPPCLRVNTTRAGSVQAPGAIKDVDTSYAGSVKITFTGGSGDGKKGATESGMIYLPLAMLAGGVAIYGAFARS